MAAGKQKNRFDPFYLRANPLIPGFQRGDTLRQGRMAHKQRPQTRRLAAVDTKGSHLLGQY